MWVLMTPVTINVYSDDVDKLNFFITQYVQ